MGILKCYRSTLTAAREIDYPEKKQGDTIMLKKLLFVGLAASGLVGWFAPASAIKLRASVERIDGHEKIVIPDGTILVIDKKKPQHKQRQG